MAFLVREEEASLAQSRLQDGGAGSRPGRSGRAAIVVVNCEAWMQSPRHSCAKSRVRGNVGEEARDES